MYPCCLIKTEWTLSYITGRTKFSLMKQSIAFHEGIRRVWFLALLTARIDGVLPASPQWMGNRADLVFRSRDLGAGRRCWRAKCRRGLIVPTNGHIKGLQSLWSCGVMAEKGTVYQQSLLRAPPVPISRHGRGRAIHGPERTLANTQTHRKTAHSFVVLPRWYIVRITQTGKAVELHLLFCRGGG